MIESENNLQEKQLSPKEAKLKKIRKFLLLLIALIAFNAFIWGTLYFATVGK